jgi:hypothetical protein
MFGSDAVSQVNAPLCIVSTLFFLPLRYGLAFPSRESRAHPATVNRRS